MAMKNVVLNVIDEKNNIFLVKLIDFGISRKIPEDWK